MDIGNYPLLCRVKKLQWVCCRTSPVAEVLQAYCSVNTSNNKHICYLCFLPIYLANIYFSQVLLLLFYNKAIDLSVMSMSYWHAFIGNNFPIILNYAILTLLYWYAMNCAKYIVGVDKGKLNIIKLCFVISWTSYYNSKISWSYNDRSFLIPHGSCCRD